jgi:hypothetical protein
MTTDRPTTLPPGWAESLLRMLLSEKDRDSVSGDLLEEFRESIVPSRGRGANRWYIRQAGGYLLREAWTWGALIAAILVTRLLFDSLAPIHYTPGVVPPRGAIMSWALIATFALGAAWHAWRTGHLRSGLLLTLVTAVIGGVLSSAGTVVCIAIWHDPETMRAIQGSGGLDEALWGVPLLLIPIGLITGTAGAIVGKALAWPLARASRGA